MRTIWIGLIVLGIGIMATFAAGIWLIVLGYRADAGIPVAESDGWIQLAAAVAITAVGAIMSIIGGRRRHTRRIAH